MAFSVISISSDSSEDSVGTSTARVILFGTIPTTIPPTTPTTDLLDPYETVVARWRSRVVVHSSPPSSPIRQILPAPPGLPRKLAVLSVGSLPDLRLASRYPSDSSSSDSPSRYSSSGYATSDSLDDSSTATSARLSHKRCRSPTSSVPAVSPVRGSLSPVRVDLSPPPKMIRDSDSVIDMEVGLGVDSKDSYEPYTELDIDSDILADIDECITYADAIRARGMDDRDVVETTAEEEVRSRERDIVKVEVDPRVGSVIEDDVCESVREDVLDHVTADGAVEVTYETLGGSVQRFHDHTIEIPVHRIQVIESEHRRQRHRITGVDLEVTTMTERISALERDNMRLRGMLDV
ncbi:hypothetical protein Tco_0602131 [Tanacetum coccineum]